MAKLPALISVLAKRDPRGVPAVENLTREMRKNGLLTQGKRGVGAPDMTYSDITNTLFTMASRQAKDAPAAARQLRLAAMVAEWDEQDRKDADAFLASLSIADRMANEEGVIQAGRFVDAIIEDMTLDGAVDRNDGNEAEFHIALEILDPLTGEGAVKVIFSQGFDTERTFIFRNSAPNSPIGIQQAAFVPPIVLHDLTDLMRRDV